MAEVLPASGFGLAAADGPSRWSANRLIDFGFCSEALAVPAYSPVEWSDHKAVLFWLPLAVEDRARLLELVPPPKHTPSEGEHEDAFRLLVSRCWDAAGLSFLGFSPAWGGLGDLREEALQNAVDDLWSELEGKLEKVLWQAALLGRDSGMSFPGFRVGFRRAKGLPLQWRKRTPHPNCSYRDDEANRMRVMRKGSSSGVRLQLGGPGTLSRLRSVGLLTAAELASRILREEARVKRARLSAWKSRLRCDKEAFKWLKRSKEPIKHNVVDDEHPSVQLPTTNPAEALEAIISFWKRIWDRSSEGEVPVEQYLQEHGPERAEVEWSAVSAQDLLAAARRQKYKRSGLDGWDPSETLALPPPAWQLLARVFRVFETQGCFPSRACLRQGHIPKDGACEGDIKVSALRPISVASVWWRLWASARVRSEEVRAWTELVLPNYVVGQKGSRCAV